MYTGKIAGQRTFRNLVQLRKRKNRFVSERVREYSSHVDLQCRFNYLSENGSSNSLAERNLSRAESPICNSRAGINKFPFSLLSCSPF